MIKKTLIFSQVIGSIGKARIRISSSPLNILYVIRISFLSSQWNSLLLKNNQVEAPVIKILST